MYQRQKADNCILACPNSCDIPFCRALFNAVLMNVHFGSITVQSIVCVLGSGGTKEMIKSFNIQGGAASEGERNEEF